MSGNAAHSSQVFSERVGAGAIYETSIILNTFYQQLTQEENLTFSPGVILGEPPPRTMMLKMAEHLMAKAMS